MACLQAGDTFMGLNLSHGGHLSHGSAVNFSGLMFNAIGYDLDPETGRVNYDDLELKARTHKPKLIIAGASAYSREWDYARIRRVADEIGALFMVDMAHPAGLIAAGLLENPLKYAHIITSTTHKSGDDHHPQDPARSARRPDSLQGAVHQADQLCGLPWYTRRTVGARDSS